MHPEDSVRVHLTFSTVLKLKGHCAIERADGHLSTWTKRYLCSDSKRTVRVVKTAGVGICFCDLAKGSRVFSECRITVLFILREWMFILEQLKPGRHLERKSEGGSSCGKKGGSTWVKAQFLSQDLLGYDYHLDGQRCQ